MYSGQYVGLQVVRSYSKYDLVVCPYHDDTHPSGLFWKESGDYYCPACKTSKKIRELLVDMGREDEFEGYAAQIAMSFNLVTVDDPMRSDGFVSLTEDEMALGYLEGRHIPLTVAEEHGVMYSPMHEELVFKTGVGVGWIGRRIANGEGPRYRIHGPKGAFWPHTAKVTEADRIILSEGPFKSMILSTIIEPGAVSVASMGSNPPLIFWQTMAQFASNMLLIADNDEPGKKFAVECKRRLPGIRVFAPRVPFDEMPKEKAFDVYAQIFKRSQSLGGF